MPGKQFPRGSEWRKWDLHIHTPASIVHAYPGPDPWESFLTGLEGLPQEFKVVGINDYLFIDGYRRVVAEKAKGRLGNIETIFPVIELRLNTFGGTASHLSRLNYHVIFSDELDPDIIEQQFLSALSSKYVLTPQFDEIRTRGKWAAVPTRQSLEDLGKLIIGSVPKKERPNYGSPLVEGFNNLCVSVDAVQKALESPYFQGKYLTAVGKTEWADIKWNDHSIADKKTIINGADLVFISAENAETCSRAREALVTAGVNSRLLDCSDAHALATATTKDRLGKCVTWIKADPTFNGLRQLLYEVEGRVHLGDEPPSLARVREKATKYMKEVRFSRSESAKAGENWFADSNIPLNHGLIAIIGNKGSGKSALADILALLGDTTAYAHFSFLRQDRFLAPKTRLGGMFRARVEWHSGRVVVRELGDSIDRSPPELVKYIPQNYLETICTELRESSDTAFDRELMEVIFSHVSEAERLALHTLPELIEHLTSEREKRIGLLTRDLVDVNQVVVDLEDQLTDDYRRSVEAQLIQRQAELEVHDNAKPVEVREPDRDPDVQDAAKAVAAELSELQSKATALEAALVGEQDRLALLARQAAAAVRLLARIDNLERQLVSFFQESVDDREVLGIDLERLVVLEINSAPIVEARENAQGGGVAAKEALSPEVRGSVAAQRVAVLAEMEERRSRLDEPSRRYQQYQQQVTEWQAKRSEIEGSVEKPSSVRGLQAKLDALRELPARLADRRQARMTFVREIFETKGDLLADYQRLYSPVQQFIDNHPVSRQHGALQFSASMSVDGLLEGFLEMIHGGRKGSFQLEEGRERLKQLVLGSDFSTQAGVEAFLASVQDHLARDMGDPDKKTVQLREQLRQDVSPREIYDFLYGLSYLKPRFELRWQQKPLDQLSPGERGNLLLVFYLLIDKRDVPLIIDQPEENLDNQTIATTLVPAVRYAKDRRQIVIVTHNPNLAVVCDADQVIHAHIDKVDGNRLIYTTGAIENPTVTQLIVDVLEGTKPAFDLRDAKYEVLERLS